MYARWRRPVRLIRLAVLTSLSSFLSCSLFNGGTLEQWLSNISSWSTANPTEVLTLLIVNSDDLPVSRYAQAFESTGIASKVYNPTAAGVGSAGALTRSQWPTLGALVDAGTPIVVFLNNNADTSSVGCESHTLHICALN